MFSAPRPEIKELHIIINSSKKHTLVSVETHKINIQVENFYNNKKECKL